MSKRTRNEGDLSQYDDGSLFCEMARVCGLVLSDGEQPNRLAVDQGKFIKELEERLRHHPRHPEVVSIAVGDVRSYLEDRDRLTQALAPTPRSPSSAGSADQDSVVRLLLRVAPFQQPLCEFLLEKMVQVAVSQGEDDNFHVRVLSQLRWLDGLHTSEEFAEKLFEALPALPADVCGDVILALPDVLQDARHPMAAVRLGKMLTENRELTPAILEAVANLGVEPKLFGETRATMLSTLKSAEVAHLPVLVKFVLGNVTPKEAPRVVSELRDGLDFRPALPRASSSTPKTQRTEEDYQLLTVNEIRNAVRFEKFLGDAWAKVVENLRTPAEHKPLDLLFLVVWHSTSLQPKAAENLLKAKVRRGHLTRALLETTFASHGQVLRAYSGTVLELAQVLLWCSDPSVLEFGGHLYRWAFLCFEGSTRQEVVVNLVTHVGSGVPAQMDAAFGALDWLVREQPRLAAPYGAFFKSMLDFVRNLSLSQFRTLFSLIANVAYRGGEQGAMFRDELHVYIRKMLTSFCPRSQRIGLVGALGTVRAMSAAQGADGTEACSGTSARPPPLRDAVELLELCRSSTLAVPHALGLFYDELSRIILRGELHRSLEVWIGDTMIADFQDDYVVDVEGSRSCSEAELSHGLDDLPDGAVAVGLGPLLEAERRGSAGRHSSALTLCPLFRLLRVTEQTLHGDSLEGIDALLGCPVRMPASKASPVGPLECTAAFHCLNWFRELVNGFCSIRDGGVCAKVVDRVKRIVDLQNSLEKWLSDVPGYVPPLASLDLDGARPIATTAPPAKRAQRKGTKGSKRRKVSEQEEWNRAPAEEQLDDEPEIAEGGRAESASKPSWRPYLRELDLEAFAVLSAGLQCEEASSEAHEGPAPGGFSPAELLFLLDDLDAKLERALSAPGAKQRPFKGKTSEEAGFSNLDSRSTEDVVKLVLRILPDLLSLLEDVSAYFQHQLATQDGVVDGPRGEEMGACMTRLLEILHHFLAWSGFDSASNRDRLREALRAISSRAGTTQLTQVHILELGKRAFSYLCGFEESVCDPESAAALVRLLACLGRRAEPRGTSDRTPVRDVARRFLCRAWPTPRAAAPLQALLGSFLQESPSVLQSLSEIVGEQSAADDLRGFLDRCSPSVYCKTMFVQLVECSQQLSFEKTGENESEQLEKWTVAVDVFQKLVAVVKKGLVRNNLSAGMRYGRLFVEQFLRGGMPLLDALFPSRPAEVQALLRSLQHGTRFLHHVCGHSKVVKDVGLTVQVPAVKKTLETLVFRVKAMLQMHKCQEAFWLGNLKNRDLQGEEILSQATVSEDAAEEGEGSDDRDELEESEDY